MEIKFDRLGLGYAVVNVCLRRQDLILWEIFDEARIFNSMGLASLFCPNREQPPCFPLTYLNQWIDTNVKNPYTFNVPIT